MKYYFRCVCYQDVSWWLCILLQTQPCQEGLGFHCQGGSNKPHNFITKLGDPTCFVFLFTISLSTALFWIVLMCFACLGRELPWFSVRAVFVLLAYLGVLSVFLNIDPFLWACTDKEEGTNSRCLICALHNTDWVLCFTERQVLSLIYEVTVIWFVRLFFLWITCPCSHRPQHIPHVLIHIITVI